MFFLIIYIFFKSNSVKEEVKLHALKSFNLLLLHIKKIIYIYKKKDTVPTAELFRNKNPIAKNVIKNIHLVMSYQKISSYWFSIMSKTLHNRACISFRCHCLGDENGSPYLTYFMYK